MHGSEGTPISGWIAGIDDAHPALAEKVRDLVLADPGARSFRSIPNQLFAKPTE